ncbi:MAG: UDP-N-acetylglucosamine 2-epimerase (non-hydrolyzing) [Dehalococcoidia bacterium]
MRSSHFAQPVRVLAVLGTRPEAIKLAPVLVRARQRWSGADAPLRLSLCTTGQHREMLVQVLELFGLVPDVDLAVMTDNQTPSQVAAAVLTGLAPLLAPERPDWVMVQGDTTTVAAASLAAYYAGARVAHVEAGLRTHDKWRPFPEEVNRRIAGAIADLHFAPTRRAQDNLLREDVPASQIVLTGNTVVDALQQVVAQPISPEAVTLLDRARLDDTTRLVFVTAHRRESFGPPFEQICLALRDLARHDPGIRIVYPVHLNPNVQEPVRRILSDEPNVVLAPPVDYLTLIHLIKRARIVLTDSGGIQEEAPGLGVPALVLREVTERPEGVEAGVARLVGTDRDTIVREALRLLYDDSEHQRMARAVNPYGDGRAADRILDAFLGNPVVPFGMAGAGVSG